MISLVEQDLGRARNAVQDFLIHKLLVPRVYLDADWDGTLLEVLAIDRAGVGDVHAVKIVPVTAGGGSVEHEELVTHAALTVHRQAREILPLSCHYKYVALLTGTAALRGFRPTEALIRELTAADGVGRIGVLIVDFADGDATVQVAVKPERFRSAPGWADFTDKFVAEHTANWEVRD